MEGNIKEEAVEVFWIKEEENDAEENKEMDLEEKNDEDKEEEEEKDAEEQKEELGDQPSPSQLR